MSMGFPSNRAWLVRLLFIACLTCLPYSAARPQALTSDPAAAARAVGTAFLKAVQAADWKAAAGFLDLAAIDSLRRSQVSAARRQHPNPPLTVERLMRMDTTMPRAVAEYQVKRMADYQLSESFLEHEFGVKDPDSLLALPIEVAARKWLEVHDERFMERRAMRTSGCMPASADTLFAAPVERVLGVVVRDSVAYLLHERERDQRFDPYELYSSPPQVMLLYRTRDIWWVVPRSDLLGTMGISVFCERLTPTKPLQRQPKRRDGP